MSNANDVALPATRLSLPGLRMGILRLTRRLERLQAFNIADVVDSRTHPSLDALRAYIDDGLEKTFGRSTPAFARFSNASSITTGPVNIYGEDVSKARAYVHNGIERSKALISEAVLVLEEELEERGEEDLQPAIIVSGENPENRRVFIVHGHDDGSREAVARFLGGINFTPIILHEQVSRSRTIIEKIEAEAEVGFAVVIFTADDQGGKLGEPLEPRARQNVLLELGYFMGKLGRGNVCVLRKGNVSIPTDFAGAIWIDMDEGAGWKRMLARELAAAGLAINWEAFGNPG